MAMICGRIGSRVVVILVVNLQDKGHKGSRNNTTRGNQSSSAITIKDMVIVPAEGEADYCYIDSDRSWVNFIN